MTSTARCDLVRERFARQALADRRCPDVVAGARVTTAVQAQDASASRLGLRSRTAGVTEHDVRHAIEHDRTVVRTWLMRGTIHLVDAADLRWLVRLVGPVVARKYETRWQGLGITAAVRRRATEVLPEILAAGPLPRREICAALAERGIAGADPQFASHVLLHASTEGLICRGPDARDATFVLLDDWVPSAPAGPHGDEALAELARRYFAAYSPATAADFVTWSGLPGSRAIELIREALAPADVDGRPGFRLGEVAPGRGLRLLPAFDNYLIGYRDRAAIVAPDLQQHIYQGGMIRPVVVRDGAAIGTWALDRTRGRVSVIPFAPLPAVALRQVETEATDLGRFLGRELALEIGRPVG